MDSERFDRTSSFHNQISDLQVHNTSNVVPRTFKRYKPFEPFDFKSRYRSGYQRPPSAKRYENSDFLGQRNLKEAYHSNSTTSFRSPYKPSSGTTRLSGTRTGINGALGYSGNINLSDL